MDINTIVTFDVYGVYTQGNLAGKVNPKAHATIEFVGSSFKDCKSKLERQTDGAFFKVRDVINLDGGMQGDILSVDAGR